MSSLLTGQSPDGRDLIKILEASIPRASDRCPDLPKGFDDVIAHAMAKQVEQRFRTCAALAAAANDVLGVIGWRP
jgi:hypothetical protein